MKSVFPTMVWSYIAEFANFYHETKVRTEHLRAVKYRIVSSLDEYKKTNKIELAITDRPGDLLPALTIEKVKSERDILAHMHPIDVNSINDLYYLSQEQPQEVRVAHEKVVVTTQEGNIVEYDINDQIDINQITSTHVSYLLGHMQAEKLLRQVYNEEKSNRFEIIRDNITTLHILDHQTKSKLLKSPDDILFSGDYKFYSKYDIARIGYICGQMTGLNKR